MQVTLAEVSTSTAGELRKPGVQAVLEDIVLGDAHAEAEAAREELLADLLDEARAAMQSLQQGSRDELQQWSGLVEDYAQRVDGLQGELADSRQQAAQFAAENDIGAILNDANWYNGRRKRSKFKILKRKQQTQKQQ